MYVMSAFVRECMYVVMFMYVNLQVFGTPHRKDFCAGAKQRHTGTTPGTNLKKQRTLEARR